MAEPSSTLQDPCCSKTLLEVATPDLYCSNAFRVLGIPVTVTPADLSKHQKQLFLMAKIGVVSPSRTQGYLPLKLAPDADAIRKATQRLLEPESRLIDEIFWFWPLNGQDPHADMTQANRWPTNVTDTVDIWSKLLDNKTYQHIAHHNLAVYHHALALDLNSDGDNASVHPVAMTTRSDHWCRALQHWRAVAEDDTFWRHIAVRVREIDDPRLTADTVRRLRHTLPEAVLRISASLAVRAAKMGDAVPHVAHMRSSGFQPAIIAAVLERAVSPLVDQIKAVCEPVQAKAEADPDHADELIRRVVDDTRPLIQAIDAVLEQADPLRGNASNTVARVIRESAVILVNKTGNWERCLQLVALAQKYAVDEDLHAQLREDIGLLEKKCREEQERQDLKKAVSGSQTYEVTIASDVAVVPAVCICCMTDADCQQTVSRTWQKGSLNLTRSFAFPVCKDCLRHQSEYSRKVGLLIWVPALISTGLVTCGVLTMNDIDWPGLVLAGAGLTAVLLLIIGWGMRLSLLGEDHACRGVAVSMPGASSEHTTFRFDNPLYALAFARSNNVQAIPRQSIKPPRGRRILASKRVVLWIVGAVILGAIAQSILFALIREDSQRISNRASYRTTPSLPSSGYSARGNKPTYTPPPYVALSYGSSDLSSKINAGKIRATAMESELTELDSASESLSGQLDQYKRAIEGYEFHVQAGIEVNQYSYQEAIDLHNTLARQYNVLLASRRSKYNEYQQEISSVNDMVRRHNAGQR